MYEGRKCVIIFSDGYVTEYNGKYTGWGKFFTHCLFY